MAEATENDPSVVQKALRGGSYLFLQKIFTFALNSFVLRKLHLNVTGAATVHCELALATIFILRDGMRLGFLRVPSLETSASDEKTSKQHQEHKRRVYIQQLVNVAWLSTVVSWLLAVLIAYTISYWNPTANANGLQDYVTVMRMFCIAAMVEALAEPMYVLAHCSVYVSWQVTAQGLGFLMRGCVQYVCIFLLDLGFLAHGYAEIAYGMTVLVVFGWLFHRRLQAAKVKAFALHSMMELLPGRPLNAQLLEPRVLKILFPLSLQSAVKYLLTEGDKWVLTCFASFQNMGVYGIVFHLGSLVPRIVFLPIEEATKTIFSKMNHNKHDDGFRLLQLLLKIMHLIGLVFVCFGTNYAHTLVLLLYGVDKTRMGVAQALAMYCVYIHFLGVNGICEAIVHAVGNERQLMALNKRMTLFFVLYCLSAMVFMSVLHYGTVGLILANCVNMASRILYCLSFLAHYFGHSVVNVLIASLPDRRVLVAFALAWTITRSSKYYFLHDPDRAEIMAANLLHLVVGSCSFLMTMLTVYVCEGRMLKDQARTLRQRPHQD